MKFLVAVLLAFVTFSCSDYEIEIPREARLGTTHYNGIYIVNGPRQGLPYSDSLGTQYTYRYITSTLYNDTTVPVRLVLSIPKNYRSQYENKGLHSIVFLLPRTLTPEFQQFDDRVSLKLKRFLDFETESSVTLDKTINPNETCTMTFGLLTNVKYPEPFAIVFGSKDNIPLNTNLSAIPLELVFDNRIKIPCGQISFPGH